jgi:hypothetical protein
VCSHDIQLDSQFFPVIQSESYPVIQKTSLRKPSQAISKGETVHWGSPYLIPPRKGRALLFRCLVDGRFWWNSAKPVDGKPQIDRTSTIPLKQWWCSFSIFLGGYDSAIGYRLGLVVLSTCWSMLVCCLFDYSYAHIYIYIYYLHNIYIYNPLTSFPQKTR